MELMRTTLVVAVVVAGLAGCAGKEPSTRPSAGAGAPAGQAVAGNRLGAGDWVGADLRTPQVQRIETASLPQD